MRDEVAVGQRVTRSRGDVCDQARLGTFSVHECQRGVDVTMRCERVAHLIRLDAETAHLDLIVTATVEHQRPIGGAVHHVAGAIHQPAARSRIGDESCSGQTRTAEVTACDSRSCEVQLTGYVVAHGIQSMVENQCGATDNRLADRDRLAGTQRLRHRRHDRGLGGSVAVDATPSRCPGCHEFCWRRLAPDAERPEQRQRRRCGCHERGGCDEGVRHRVLGEELDELVSAEDGRRRDDHRRTRVEGEEELQERRIETG
ncbi:Uncharacterised protein [Mycobacteroides abscessus subsp. abscessus]|nr:Uncharacterised protein [Mycobacteroides abscessus subsp. abscessus]